MTTVENLNTNKRKFISDDEEHYSSRIFPTDNQIETNFNSKKVKSIETERVSSTTNQIDDTDDMMICENSNTKPNEINKIDDNSTNKPQAVLVPKHCNSLCNADASPTTLIVRCYCDPYRLNSIIPYDSDIY